MVVGGRGVSFREDGSVVFTFGVVEGIDEAFRVEDPFDREDEDENRENDCFERTRRSGSSSAVFRTLAERSTH